jgi:1,4-dihydroxy-2-naphthoyl-CoA hydrolase
MATGTDEGDRDAGLPAELGPVAPPGPWLADLGFEIDEASASRLTGHLVVGPNHHTPWGVVHGGVYTTVIETAASIGASLAAVERAHYAVGLNNSTDFLRATQEGRLDVVAEPIVQGRTQQLWDVTITRDDGKPVARGRVRLQNLPLPS